MITFEDNELEIAIVTYNRPKFIEEWLKENYSETLSRNIKLTIYDSSTNKDTEELIQQFNRSNNSSILFYRIPSYVDIGYKPMFPILNSTAKYLWVSGDSRYHCFTELDEKVFPYIKRQYDYICLWDNSGRDIDGKDYTEINDFIHDGFIPTTCIGLSIYKTALFAPLKNDKEKEKQLDSVFKSNFAFAWLGYFYSMLYEQSFLATIRVVKIYHIRPQGIPKVQTWYARFYESWIANLCDLIDSIPGLYPTTKEFVIRDVWDRNSFHGADVSYGTRKQGILNSKTIKEYEQNGMLQRVIKDRKHMLLVKAYAYAPLWMIETTNCLHKTIFKKKH